MQIEFTCPHCGAVNQTSSINQGNSVLCVSCKSPVEVALLPDENDKEKQPINFGPMYRKPPSEGWICSDCGLIGDGKPRGDFIIELLLWLFMCLPGIIYTLWRHGAKCCPTCKGKMINIQTPRGSELVGRYHIR